MPKIEIYFTRLHYIPKILPEYANDNRLNHDLSDLNDEHDLEILNHSADNVTPIHFRSSFRNPCQQGVHKKALDIILMLDFYVESVLFEWLTFNRNSHGVKSSKPFNAKTTHSKP